MLARWVTCLGVVFCALGVLAPTPAAAGDVTVFVAACGPVDLWDTGYGAALSFSFFRYISLEGEVVRLPAHQADSVMTSFMGSAALSLPIRSVTLYGGLGWGFFQQEVAGETDLGGLKGLVLGVKIRIADLIVIRGDYRKFDLGGTPPIEANQRVSIGAGLAF